MPDFKEQNSPPLVRIVHQDDRIVVVEKPSGLVVHRGWVRSEEALLQIVRDRVGAYVHPIHRLDRSASGLVVFALDTDTARDLSQAFAEGRVSKTYLAITRGHPPKNLVVDHPVPKGPKAPRIDAVTEIRCVETFGRYALVQAVPRTGRFHQIRRHLKHISCPIIGDVNYGKGEHNRIFREQHGLFRLALHSIQLEFTHPADGSWIRLESELPSDIRAAAASCRHTYGKMG